MSTDNITLNIALRYATDCYTVRWGNYFKWAYAFKNVT